MRALGSSWVERGGWLGGLPGDISVGSWSHVCCLHLRAHPLFPYTYTLIPTPTPTPPSAASPKIGTTPSQPGMHTPGKGELPPPPASLVEKFLRDHNFLAVAQEQMQVQAGVGRVGWWLQESYVQGWQGEAWQGGRRSLVALCLLPVPYCASSLP